MRLDWVVFWDGGFQTVCLLMEKNKRLIEASWWERLRGKLGLVLMQGAMLSKSLSFCWWVELCFLPAIYLGPTYGGGNEDNGDFFQMIPCICCYTQCPQPCSRPPPTHTSAGDSWTLTGKSGSVSCGVTQRLRQNCVRASPVEVRVSSGLPQGRGLWVQQTWVWHRPSWRRSPLTPP